MPHSPSPMAPGQSLVAQVDCPGLQANICDGKCILRREVSAESSSAHSVARTEPLLGGIAAVLVHQDSKSMLTFSADGDVRRGGLQVRVALFVDMGVYFPANHTIPFVTLFPVHIYTFTAVYISC